MLSALLIISVIVASCGAGLTAYTLLGIGERRTALWALTGPFILSAGLGLLIIAFSMMQAI